MEPLNRYILSRSIDVFNSFPSCKNSSTTETNDSKITQNRNSWSARKRAVSRLWPRILKWNRICRRQSGKSVNLTSRQTGHAWLLTYLRWQFFLCVSNELLIRYHFVSVTVFLQSIIYVKLCRLFFALSPCVKLRERPSNMHDGGWMKDQKVTRNLHHASACCKQRCKFTQRRNDWKKRPVCCAHFPRFVFSVFYQYYVACFEVLYRMEVGRAGFE